MFIKKTGYNDRPVRIETSLRAERSMDAIQKGKSNKEVTHLQYRSTVYVNIMQHIYIYTYISVCLYDLAIPICIRPDPLNWTPLNWLASKDVVAGTMLELERVRRVKRVMQRAGRRALKAERARSRHAAWARRAQREVRALLQRVQELDNQAWGRGVGLGPGRRTSTQLQ